MVVFCHNEFRIGSNGTVNKLIVIRVGSNKIPLIRRRYHFDILALHNSIDNISGRIDTDISCYNLRIFFKNIV